MYPYFKAKIIRIIGEGSYGVVNLIEDEDGNKYAAKKIEIFHDNDKTKDYQKETMVEKIGFNPAILPIHGVYILDEEDQTPFIISEYEVNGSLQNLFDLILKNEDMPQGFSIPKLYIILIGTCLGIIFLHSNSIIHRDLKPGNILLDKDFYPHISDFGSAYESDKQKQQILMMSCEGTPIYMAPEINGDDTYTYKVDIYSFALIFYQLITRKKVYKQASPNAIFISNEKKAKNLSNIASNIKDISIRNFIKQCWSSNPDERPDANEIFREIIQEKYMKLFGTDIDDVHKYLSLFNKEFINSIYIINVKAPQRLIGSGGNEMSDKYYFNSITKSRIEWMNSSARSLTFSDNNTSSEMNQLKIRLNKGDANAMFQYANLFLSGDKFPVDKKVGFEHLKMASDKGNFEATFKIGKMYYNGEGAPVDKKEALRCYCEVADKTNNPEAMYLCGMMLIKGEGSAADKPKGFSYLKKSVDAGYKKALLDYAKLLYEDNKKKEAAKYFILAAQKNNAEAMFYIAEMLFKGDGIPMDKEKAKEFYKNSADRFDSKALFKYGEILFEKNQKEALNYIQKAAIRGNSEAMLKYGEILYDHNKLAKKQEAAFYFKMAANRGNHEAIRRYADMLNEGSVININKTEAARLYFKYGLTLYNNDEIDSSKEEAFIYIKKSADLGNQFACHKAGSMYCSGEGTEVNKILAAEYYKKSADKGNAKACFDYGVMLNIGEGIAQNYHKAAKYFKNAADKGLKKAMFKYGYMLDMGKGIKANKNEAAKYYKMSADKGLSYGMLHYGNMALKGEGVPANINEAMKYLKMSADNNNPKGMVNYAFLLLNSELDNKKEAAYYFKISADNGNAEAMYNYAIMLLRGDGIKKNEQLAMEYLKKAAENGNINAMNDYGVRLYISDSKSIKEALQLIKASADQGNADAMFNYGYFLLYESVDINKAFYYLKSAAKKGNIEAMNTCGAMLMDGDEIQPDIKTAARFLKKSADLGNDDSMYRYAKIIFNGFEGTDANKEEAAYYFKKSANENNNPKSMYYYGKMLFKGIGINGNEKEALKYLKKSASLKNTKAISYLENIVANKGAPNDKKQAMESIKIGARK